MRIVLVLLTITLFTFTLPLEQLYAKRFGGGRSFGVQRSIAANPVRKPNPMSTIRQQGNRWLAPMIGLAAGAILGSLLMNHGFGAGLLSWLLIAGGILLFISLLRNRKTMTDSLQYQSSQPNPSPFQHALSRLDPQFQNTDRHPSEADFDDDAFLREAKVIFLRLQAAYDQKDMHDLKQFTAPQVFAEIQMQLQERGEAVNKTEVSSLTAELLEIITEMEYNQEIRTASVRFSGMVKESPSEPAAAFVEVWHFQSKPNSSDWLVAGIQQA